MISILLSFLILILLVFTLFFTGFAYVNYILPQLKSRIQDDFYKITSVYLAAGFILITIILSNLYTCFSTINIFPLIVVLTPLFRYNSIKFVEKVKIQRPTKKQVFIVLFLLFSVFSYNSSVYFRSNNYFFYDLVYYGKLSSGLLKSGIENPLVIYNNYISSEKQALYHYGDLWLTGFISKVFHFSEVKSLVFIVYPLLHFLVLLLLISIYSIKGKISLWNFLLVFGLLYGIKLFLKIDFGNDILNASKQYRGVPYPTSANKLLCIYLLILFSYLLYKLKLKKHSFIVFSITPIFYSVLVPSFAGISLALVIMSLINIRFIVRFWDLKLNEVAYSCLGIIFLLIYIKLLPFEKSDTLPLKLYSIKTYIVLLLETIVKVFFEYFILFFLLLFFLIKSKGLILFKPFIFIPIIGLLSGFLFIYIHVPGSFNLHQIISALSPILLLILAIELFYMVEEFQMMKKILIVIFVLFGVWNLSYFKFIPNEFGIRKSSITFSKEFSNRVFNSIEKSKNEFISSTVRMIATNEFRDDDNSRWDYDFQNKFQDFYYSNKAVFPLEIGNLFSQSKEIYSKSHPYFKMYHDGIVRNSRIVTFLKRKKINYLFVENEKELPIEFLSNFNCLTKDKLTGASFWKLKLN